MEPQIRTSCARDYNVEQILIVPLNSDLITFWYIWIILWKINPNKFNLKNLRILARHKFKNPWWWHRNVETCRSMYYTKRYLYWYVIVHRLVVIKAIQKVYTTIINNTKGLCIVNKCCVYTDSFVVTCKFEADREM